MASLLFITRTDSDKGAIVMQHICITL